MSEKGWIKNYRQSLDNPVVSKDAEHFAIWNFLLLSATHRKKTVIFGGKKIELQPGQLITGRKSIAQRFRVNETKVYRVMKAFESEHQIEQQTSNKNSLVTIVNWHLYQSDEQQNEQQVNNKRTTTEQQLNTNKNERSKEEKKKDIKERNIIPPTIEMVKAYCQERGNRVDAVKFFDHYEANGWFRGKTKMKDWQSAVRTWEGNDFQKPPSKKKDNYEKRDFDYDSFADEQIRARIEARKNER